MIGIFLFQNHVGKWGIVPVIFLCKFAIFVGLFLVKPAVLLTHFAV